mmetsp:Transcript_21365/g.33044  ORF Transcript_21365/g.33044 Transcript_21365/m.33044 type:complete len:185 (+) Transcript_21365:613-1167(+)
MKYVATTSNNNKIDFWDSNTYSPKESIDTSNIQLCIKWCGEGVNRLFTGGCDKWIYAYDPLKLCEVGNNEQKDLDKKRWEDINVKHTKSVLDLLPIPKMNLLVSASLDSNMCLWSMDTLQGKSIHTDHQKGIYSLEWLEDSKLILSAGLDHDIYIWNPLVTEKIFFLKGHNHSLVGVKWLKGTN